MSSDVTMRDLIGRIEAVRDSLSDKARTAAVE